MWSLKGLTPDQISRCERTISSNTLLFLIGDALTKKEPLSVVRMADGENIIMNWCKQNEANKVVTPTAQLDAAWIKKFGLEGITYGELQKRLIVAANECKYFAASLSGIIIPNYNVDQFSNRAIFADNFFTYAWTEEYKKALYKMAHYTLVIHHSEELCYEIRTNVKKSVDAEVMYLKLNNWTECEDVIKTATMFQPNLVLFSAGPAGKYIGPRIAAKCSCVTLDIGSGMERWKIDGIARGSGELIDILH